MVILTEIGDEDEMGRTEKLVGLMVLTKAPLQQWKRSDEA
jgi:hypothetical protein